MARLRHIAVCVSDLDKAAEFYAKVFEFKRIGREDLDIGSAIYMSDGVINMALLNFKGKGGARPPTSRKARPSSARTTSASRSTTSPRRRRRSRRPAASSSSTSATSARQFRAQVQGPRRGDLRHLEARLAGHRRV